jgi:Asp/Glu/hydantoin racemase
VEENSIANAPGAHDDIANAVAGALVTAYKEPGVANFRNVIVFPKVGVA